MIKKNNLNNMWWHVLVILCCVYPKINTLLYPIVDPNKVYKYSPPEDEVTFHLYHFSDFSRDEQIFIGNTDSIDGSRFDPNLPTKILIHGWTHGKDVPWLKEMREAMAMSGEWNVIVVDWAPLSHVIYIEARVHTPVVSKQVAEFLLFLESHKKVHMSSIHFVGHSMGAQIAAFAAFKVKGRCGQTVGRISALDPAAPLYEWPHIESLDEVLDPTDADFVDVIHTNGRHLGMMTPAGHVDFYPNGGEHQPGCGFWICSHLRACEYWTASVKNPNLFRAYSYKSWDEYLVGETDKLPVYPMGMGASSKIPQGTYFLETGDEFEQYLTTKTTLIDSYKTRYSE